MTQGGVLLPGGGFVNPAAFPFEDQIIFTTTGAAIDATSVPVIAKGVAGQVVTAGTQVDFGGDKLAILTAPFTVGTSTALTTRALVSAVVENDTATLTGGALGRKYIASGTLLGRTYVEREAGAGYGPATVASDDQIYLLAFPVVDAAADDVVELYMHGNVVYEACLPGWADLPAADKAKIRDLYACIKR